MRFSIELNIRLLFASDPKFFGQAFKIYWSRAKKKIDTRMALMKKDTQVAKFNDKFQMKTILRMDKETGEFESKPVSARPFNIHNLPLQSLLQVFLLECQEQ